MEVATEHIYLMLALVFLGFWKRYGWLMVICGLGSLLLAIDIVASDGLLYGLPYTGIGIGMVFVGAFRRDKTGKD